MPRLTILGKVMDIYSAVSTNFEVLTMIRERSSSLAPGSRMYLVKWLITWRSDNIIRGLLHKRVVPILTDNFWTS